MLRLANRLAGHAIYTPALYGCVGSLRRLRGFVAVGHPVNCVGDNVSIASACFLIVAFWWRSRGFYRCNPCVIVLVLPEL